MRRNRRSQQKTPSELRVNRLFMIVHDSIRTGLLFLLAGNDLTTAQQFSSTNHKKTPCQRTSPRTHQGVPNLEVRVPSYSTHWMGLNTTPTCDPWSRCFAIDTACEIPLPAVPCRGALLHIHSLDRELNIMKTAGRPLGGNAISNCFTPSFTPLRVHSFPLRFAGCVSPKWP